MYLHEPKAYLCCQNMNVVLSHLRGYHHRYSSLTSVIYAYSACQQLIALFPVIPVPWWADDWCPKSRRSRELKKKSNELYPRLHWWIARFQEGRKRSRHQRLLKNILGRRSYTVYLSNSKSNMSSEYVYLISNQKNCLSSRVTVVIFHELLVWFCCISCRAH